MIGYSLFSVRAVIHGAHIRPYEFCKQLDIPMVYRVSSHPIPFDLLKAIVKGKVLLVFPGYTADQLSLLLVFLAKFRRCKLILDVADIPYLQYKFFQGAPSEKSIRDFAKLVHLSDVLIFPTAGLQMVAAKGLNIDKKQSYVIGNASDPVHFEFTPLPLKKTILFVGGYIPARGVDELVEAFKILRQRGKNCILKLVGFGYPRSLQGDGVEISQNVGFTQIPPHYAKSYVFVIPHRLNPYMQLAAPIKLFDAMASGRPVVSTAGNEVAALIEKEKCGLITQTDPSSIADGIEYLLENREIATEMGRRGRVAIVERHSWKIRAEKLRDIIERN